MKALTDDQINDLNLKHGWFEFGDAQSAKTKAFVRDVEALCAEKAETELAELRKKYSQFFDSITCLCAEGVEFHKCRDIVLAVSKEAVKGYLLCKGDEDG